MSRSSELIEAGRRYFVPNYRPREVVLAHGQGARLWDLEGREYVDLGAGIGVNALGHQDPELVAALAEQGGKLWHTSNIYFTEPPIRLAQELAEATFAERVFFCNSGAEAIEAAIKLARRYAAERFLPDKREILSFEGSFHGRTLAALTATAQPKFHAGFEPLPAGFRYCPFNDRAAAAAAVTERTCAVLVEPVQGEGGVTPADPGFLRHLRELCDRSGALLVLDEIQCGMGRCGRLLAHEWAEGVVPDAVTLAKGLGGGLPIGALLAGPKVAETFQFGSHGSTFGGNPVVCAVARRVLARLRDPAAMAHVARQGRRLRRCLEGIAVQLGMFREVRGLGLMLGAELAGPWAGRAGELTEACRARGVLILQAGPDVLRFLPPLNIDDAALEDGMSRMDAALREAAG